jgi:pimeloyl-ACP methyl ester carboxylesterase
MTTRTILNGVEIVFDDVGRSSDVILLVHGHPFNRSMWEPQIEPAARAGWRVVAPDLRGYGASQVTPGTTTLDLFASDLAALLDRLALESAVVAGLSMGGQIVMEFARAYPTRVRGIVLAATTPEAETPEGKQRRSQMATRLVAEGMGPYAHEVLPRMLAPRTIAQRPGVAHHVLEMMCNTSAEGAAAALRGRAERRDYRSLLATLDVPALVVVGDQDAFTTRQDGERMSGLLAHGELIWIEESGHMPNLEQPELFNSHLIDFLDRVAHCQRVT